MLAVHHPHALPRHVVVPALSRHAVQVNRLRGIGDVWVFVPFQHGRRPRFQHRRVLDARVRVYAAFDAPCACRVRVQIGHAPVDAADVQLVHTLAVSQRIQPRHQCAGIHGLFNAHQIPGVVDAAAVACVRLP